MAGQAQGGLFVFFDQQQLLFYIIIVYFVARQTGDDTAVAPEGVCPNCWGRQEWDGEYYKQIKARNITPESNTYNNFINEVASKLDEIKLNEDTYECTTCHVNYKHDH